MASYKSILLRKGFFVESPEGGDITDVDPRWSSRSKTVTGSPRPGSAEILYGREYELPRGWEQLHYQEGNIYFVESEDGLLTEA